MLRILGGISIYGTKSSIEKLVSSGAMPNSSIAQIGSLRKKPDIDSWCYSTQWYSFNADTLDEEVRDFLVAHKKLGKVLEAPEIGRGLALFTLSPVGQDSECLFSCLLSHPTLCALTSLKLSLQIAPASVMPDVAFWCE